MKKGKVTFAILTEFSKAFDTTAGYTFERTSYNRFPAKELHLFRDYLSNRQQLIEIVRRQQNIREGTDDFGVLQRFFNLYVRTISSNGKSNYFLYPDATTMLRHAKVVYLPQTTRADLDIKHTNTRNELFSL